MRQDPRPVFTRRRKYFTRSAARKVFCGKRLGLKNGAAAGGVNKCEQMPGN
jgi:hypothetical protein